MAATKTTRKKAEPARKRTATAGSWPPNRCQHAGCDCPVEPGRSFCSDVCRAADTSHTRSATCGCGHPECRHV